MYAPGDDRFDVSRNDVKATRCVSGCAARCVLRPLPPPPLLLSDGQNTLLKVISEYKIKYRSKSILKIRNKILRSNYCKIESKTLFCIFKIKVLLSKKYFAHHCCCCWWRWWLVT